MKEKRLLIDRQVSIFSRRSECNLMTVERKTKKKLAKMVMTIPDDLAEKLINDMVNMQSLSCDPEITSFMLSWNEGAWEEKKKQD